MEKRVLIISSNATYGLLAQFRHMRYHLGFPIDMYVIRGSGSARVIDMLNGICRDKYDTLWFFVDEMFEKRNRRWLKHLFANFRGRIVKNGDITKLDRVDMHTLWRNAGVHVPMQVKGPVESILNTGIPVPLIVRRCCGHAGHSVAELIYTEEQYQDWMKRNGREEHVVEEYIDCSVDNVSHAVRVIRVGEYYHQKYVQVAPHWLVAPGRAGDLSIMETGEGCFELGKIFGFWKYDFSHYLPEIKRLFELQDMELGALDFSIINEEIIPWEVVNTFGFMTSESVFNDTFVATQRVISNDIIKYLGIDYELSFDEMKQNLYEMYTFAVESKGAAFISWDKFYKTEQII